MNRFKLGKKEIGGGCPCFIIAEIGLSHDGSLGIAHSMIDAAAAADADAVKFQTHIAEHESTKEEKFRVNVFPQDKTRFDYWKRTEFTQDEWLSLKRHSEEAGLEFLSSPFSLEAANLLAGIGIRGWKIASGETNNLPLLEKIAKTKLPVLLSTGMSYLREIETAMNLLKESQVPVLLFQCTNEYPCSPENLGLNLIQDLQEQYNVPVGLSDHSGKVFSGLAAITLGAAALEVHVTFHKKYFGPDVSSSLTFEELKLLTEGVRFIEKARGTSLNKDEKAKDLMDIRTSFMKSVVARKDLKKGTILEEEHFDFKKPGTGILSDNYKDLVGKTLTANVKKDEQILWDMTSHE